MKVEKNLARFTVHSLNRAQQLNISLDDLLKSWFDSSYYELSDRQKAYKFKRYGMASLDDFYTYHVPSDLLFTCHKSGNLNIIITITKRKENKKKWGIG